MSHLFAHPKEDACFEEAERGGTTVYQSTHGKGWQKDFEVPPAQGRPVVPVNRAKVHGAPCEDGHFMVLFEGLDDPDGDPITAARGLKGRLHE